MIPYDPTMPLFIKFNAKYLMILKLIQLLHKIYIEIPIGINNKHHKFEQNWINSFSIVDILNFSKKDPAKHSKVIFPWSKYQATGWPLYWPISIQLNGKFSYKVCPSFTAVHHTFTELIQTTCKFWHALWALRMYIIYWIVIFIMLDCLHSYYNHTIKVIAYQIHL